MDQMKKYIEYRYPNSSEIAWVQATVTTLNKLPRKAKYRYTEYETETPYSVYWTQENTYIVYD